MFLPDGGERTRASISNGPVQAVLYLPDAKNGYYRASRFDWSGVIPCLSYKGHTYFGIWFSHYDPMLADAIAGPVEEFRSTEGALDYNQAKAGGLFVKIGVGVLRKMDDSAYKYMYTYPLVDVGKWTVRATGGCFSRQRLRSPIGFAYDYQKTVMLDRHEPVFTLQHTLKNTGTKTSTRRYTNTTFLFWTALPAALEWSSVFLLYPRRKNRWNRWPRSMASRSSITMSCNLESTWKAI